MLENSALNGSFVTACKTQEYCRRGSGEKINARDWEDV